MIYTSYFAKLKSLPDNIVPISICAKAPDWYKGLQYKKLAPKYDFFMKWKENHDNEEFVENYVAQVLKQLNPIKVVADLYYQLNAAPCSCDIVLICFEKPSDFCHRHLVANWLTKNGFTCEEYKF